MQLLSFAGPVSCLLFAASIASSIAMAQSRTLEESLKIIAATTAQNLPMKLSQNMTLAQVASIGKTITYAYVIHRNYADMKPHLAQAKDVSRKEKVTSLCSEKATRSLLDAGALYKYTFVSDDAQFMFSYDVTKSDCR